MTTPPSNGQWPQGQPYDPRQGEQDAGVNYNPDTYSDQYPDQGQYAPGGQGQYGGYEQPGHQYAQPGAPYDQYGQSAEQYPQGDPYAQQYDAYTQAHDTYQPQQPWPSQQLGAPHPAQGQPGGGWGQQPPKKNKTPLIAGIAVAVVGAIVAVVILVVNSGDDDSSAGGSTTSQTQKTTEETSDGGGSGGTDIPSDVPVPSGIEVTDSFGDLETGLYVDFETDDPEATYEDWKEEFEDAGYEITDDYSDGSGSGLLWYFDAENDTYKVNVNYYSSGWLLVEKK